MRAQGRHAHHGNSAGNGITASTVLHVGGHYASEKAVVERALGARPGRNGRVLVRPDQLPLAKACEIAIVKCRGGPRQGVWVGGLM